MSVDIEAIVEQTYVHLRCTGTCTNANELIHAFQNIVAAAKEAKRARILVDAIGVEGELSTMDRYHGSAFLAEQNFQDTFRITAIAIAGREPLIDPTRFGETVARNRGVNGRVFTDLDEAITWLTSTELGAGPTKPIT